MDLPVLQMYTELGLLSQLTTTFFNLSNVLQGPLFGGNFARTKGQIKPKADWHAVDSPEKRMNEFVLFAFLLFTANKTNSFIRFWGRIYGAPKLLSVLSDL